MFDSSTEDYGGENGDPRLSRLELQLVAALGHRRVCELLHDFAVLPIVRVEDGFLVDSEMALTFDE